MAQKILSVAVPCYNSAAYMEKCIKTLLTGGDRVEIIIVDDGSTKDDTAAIGDRLAAKNPGIVTCIHQENAGHGGAVNTGIAHATGHFMKVVDSDDWVNPEAFKKVLDFLTKVVEEGEELDLFIANFVYEKVGAKKKKVMRFPHVLPVDTFFGWDQVGHFSVGQYILMHSAIYRTSVLRECGMRLPEHTFYVDNIYVYYPLPFVKRMYYMDVNLYRYYIGRADQSVNEEVMISRIDQQLFVNKLMVQYYDLTKIENKGLQKYMYQYLEIVTVISSVLLIRSGTPEHLALKKELWEFIKETNYGMYRTLRYKKFLGRGINLPGALGRKTVVYIYGICQKIFGFN